MPSFPTSGLVANVTTYSSSGRTWIWNGTTWDSIGTAQGATGSQGIQGTKGKYTVSSTPPSSPIDGDAWLDNTSARLFIYTGTEWFEPYDNFNGLQGTQGIQGIQGTTGTTNFSINNQTGTSYTLTSGDAGNFVTLNNASSITVTVPPSTFSVGQVINLQQIGIGQVTFSQGSGVTITSTGGTASAPKLRTQFSGTTVICIASNTFTIIGDIV